MGAHCRETHPRPLQISSPQLRPGQRRLWASPWDRCRVLGGCARRGKAFCLQVLPPGAGGTAHPRAAGGPGGAGAGGGGDAYRHLQAGGGGPRARRPARLVRAPPAAAPAGLSADAYLHPLPGRRSVRSRYGAAGTARAAAPRTPPRVQGEKDQLQQGRMGASGGIAVPPGAGQDSCSDAYGCCSGESPVCDDSCPHPIVQPRGGRSLPSWAPCSPVPRRKESLPPGPHRTRITMQNTIEIAVLSGQQHQQQEQGCGGQGRGRKKKRRNKMRYSSAR